MAFCAERQASGVREVGGVGVKPLLIDVAPGGMVENWRTPPQEVLLQVSMSMRLSVAFQFQQREVFCETMAKSGATDTDTE